MKSSEKEDETAEVEPLSTAAHDRHIRTSYLNIDELQGRTSYAHPHTIPHPFQWSREIPCAHLEHGDGHFVGKDDAETRAFFRGMALLFTSDDKDTTGQDITPPIIPGSSNGKHKYCTHETTAVFLSIVLSYSSF